MAPTTCMSSPTLAVASFQAFGKAGEFVAALPGQSLSASKSGLVIPQYAIGSEVRSAVTLINLEESWRRVTICFFGDDPALFRERTLYLGSFEKAVIDDPAFFDLPADVLTTGTICLAGAQLIADVHCSDAARSRFSTSLSSLDRILDFRKRLVFSHIASIDDFFTGLSIMSDENEAVPIRIEVFDAHGELLAADEFPVWYRARQNRLLTEYFPALKGHALQGGYIILTSSRPFAAFALFGSWDLSVLSAIPGQVPQ